MTTFNLDEYVGLPVTHEQSYHYFMHENFFKHVNIPRQNIHIPSGTTSNYRAFCQWYETRIKQCGGIDVQIPWHRLRWSHRATVAFNEPRQLAHVPYTAQDAGQADDRRQPQRFFSGPARSGARIYAPITSWGVGTIMEARKLVLMANGAKKADAIAAAVEGPVSAMITASALQMHEDATVFVDDPAASKLKMREYYEWIQVKKPDAPKV